MNRSRIIALSTGLFLAFGGITLTGCEEEGPVEETAEDVDDSLEDAADDVEEAADEAEEAVGG